MKEKIGQLTIVGFEGVDPSEEVLNLIEEFGIGGVILFKRNIEDPTQIRELIKLLQKSSKIPLFIAIDHEGGRISRLDKPFTKFPSAAIISSLEEAYSIGKTMGKELKDVGINMNLAPVLDINNNPNSPIGDRSFGNDPQKVAVFGNSMINGMKDMGIIPVAKHFPGYGSISIDPHLELPYRNLNRENISPFKYVIENGVEAIMTAHVIYKDIDVSMPATMSKNIIDGILRKELGFRGLVITDDLEMGAISKNFPIEEVAIKGIEAGNDILLICHSLDTQERSIKAILDKISTDSSFRERVYKSIDKIEKIKKRHLLI